MYAAAYNSDIVIAHNYSIKKEQGINKFAMTPLHLPRIKVNQNMAQSFTTKGAILIHPLLTSIVHHLDYAVSFKYIETVKFISWAWADPKPMTKKP